MRAEGSRRKLLFSSTRSWEHHKASFSCTGSTRSALVRPLSQFIGYSTQPIKNTCAVVLSIKKKKYALNDPPESRMTSPCSYHGDAGCPTAKKKKTQNKTHHSLLKVSSWIFGRLKNTWRYMISTDDPMIDTVKDSSVRNPPFVLVHKRRHHSWALKKKKKINFARICNCFKLRILVDWVSGAAATMELMRSGGELKGVAPQQHQSTHFSQRRSSLLRRAGTQNQTKTHNK